MSEHKISWQGVITHLHTTSTGSLPMQSQSDLTLITGVGIKGDRYSTTSNTGFYSDRPEPGRQITLIEQEALQAIARDHNVILEPHEHRRNVTVCGVPVSHLVGKRFQLGQTVLEATRLSTPCKHIEEVTGKSLARWMINRSGINCIIIKGGTIHVGDVVCNL